MASRLVGAKQFSGPMVFVWLIGPFGKKVRELSIKINTYLFIKCAFETVVCEMVTMLFRLKSVNQSRLSNTYVWEDWILIGSTMACHLLSDKPLSLQWRHNGHNGVSNHQPRHCSLNRLFRCRSKKTSKLRVIGLRAGNSPGTGEFLAQRTWIYIQEIQNDEIWKRRMQIKSQVNKFYRKMKLH